MKISRNWLSEFLDVPESVEELTVILDDLGLVVEGVEHVGAGLEAVVAARVDEIHAIEGADKIRRVVVDAGAGPLQIVCGAMNFVVGNFVPLAPVGAVLPGDFAIAERKMRGVTSYGMLCSGRELGLGDDHAGLLLLDDYAPTPGAPLLDTLGVTPDVVFEISPEGNRPDAWSVEGVARDLAVRCGRELREPALASPNDAPTTSSIATGRLDAPTLCGRLTVSVIADVVVGPSPLWMQQRLNAAGMRPINNVVDASNYVMLELGQPTHPYDADRVASRTIGVRQAKPGEVLVTLDGQSRELGRPGRGLGDTGEDCVIVDGTDAVIGLAGIMGGESSEISDTTTTVLLEAAFFAPMAIARTSKRLGLRTEASARFERGVDPELALRAAARFVELLRASSPHLQWLSEPIDLRGVTPTRESIRVSADDVSNLLGTEIPTDDVERILKGLRFEVRREGDDLEVIAPSARLDVRAGLPGRADVIEEIARLFSYRRLTRRTPTWPQPGGLTPAQTLRRRFRSAAVGAGLLEAWTPTLGDDEDFERFAPGQPRLRVTNPLASEESVLRSSVVPGLIRAWTRNVERGLDANFFEIGVVVTHPSVAGAARPTRGGNGGVVDLALPRETERFTALLGLPGVSAEQAVGLARVLVESLGYEGVRLVAGDVPAGWHPTRTAEVRDTRSGERLGFVGEVDPDTLQLMAGHFASGRRVAILDLDLGAMLDPVVATRRATQVAVPSRFPSTFFDLAFLTPNEVNADDLRDVIAADDLIESVALFDVYRTPAFDGARSLTYTVRATSPEGTIDEARFAALREGAIARANSLGATLR